MLQSAVPYFFFDLNFQNLDALHDHLGTIYPGMRAPSFRCTDAEKGNNLILHYYSEREGLQDIVIGIIKTVAQQIHGTEIEMKVSFVVFVTFLCIAKPLTLWLTLSLLMNGYDFFSLPFNLWYNIQRHSCVPALHCVRMCKSVSHNISGEAVTWRLNNRNFSNTQMGTLWQLQLSSEFLDNVCESQDIFRSKI